MDSKSKAGRRVARKRGVRFVDVPPSMLEAGDLRGVPVLPSEAQALADQMVGDRAIGDHKL